MRILQLFLIVGLLTGCDFGYQAIIRRPLAIGHDCPTSTRDFVYSHKQRCCAEVFEEKGVFSVNQEKPMGDYFQVFVGATGSVPERARLQVLCPVTGLLLYDSGWVLDKTAYCYDNGMYLFFFEGHSRTINSESCCPHGAVCPSKLKDLRAE